MALAAVNQVDEWLETARDCFEIARGCCSVTVPSFGHLTRLSKLNVDLTFTILQALQLHAFVRSGFDCPHLVFASRHCRLAEHGT